MVDADTQRRIDILEIFADLQSGIQIDREDLYEGFQVPTQYADTIGYHDARYLNSKKASAVSAAKRRKFSPAEVRVIRARAEQGAGIRPMARELGVDHKTIRDIVRRKTYSDV